MTNKSIEEYREFLKDSIRLEIDFRGTDQNKGLPPPPVQKPFPPETPVIDLPGLGNWESATDISLLKAIDNRQSHRKFTSEALTLEELSFLLWATQGIKRFIHPGSAFRVVPSAGCRHAFETYLAVLNVESLEPGIYRYLPVDHGLIFLHPVENLSESIISATLNQVFIGRAPVTFIWSVLPYRMEWRYHLAAARVIGMDVGHVCQNLYLACQAVGCGTCGIAAFHQDGMDTLIRVDGKDEFVFYLAPLGKI